MNEDSNRKTNMEVKVNMEEQFLDIIASSALQVVHIGNAPSGQQFCFEMQLQLFFPLKNQFLWSIN